MAENETTKADDMAERVRATLSGQPPKQDVTTSGDEKQKPDPEAVSTRSGVGSGQTNPSQDPALAAAPASVVRGVPAGTGTFSGATNPTVPNLARTVGKASAEVNAEVGEIKQQTAAGEVVGTEDPLKARAARPAPLTTVSAPAFRTGSIADRLKAIDSTLQAAEDENARVRSSDIALMRAQKDELERYEAMNVGGAPILMPRARLLDASYAKEKNPDFNYRWLNITDAGKVGARRADGWERVSEDEGGIQLGEEMALFRIPKQHHNRLRQGLRNRQERSFDQPKKQFEASLNDVAKYLRDKHGIKLTDKQIRDRINNSDE